MVEYPKFVGAKKKKAPAPAMKGKKMKKGKKGGKGDGPVDEELFERELAMAIEMSKVAAGLADAP